MPVTTGTKGVFGLPSELKAIKGVSPIHGKITLQFYPLEYASLRINDGPEIALEDCDTHWSVERVLLKESTATAVQPKAT